MKAKLHGWVAVLNYKSLMRKVFGECDTDNCHIMAKSLSKSGAWNLVIHEHEKLRDSGILDDFPRTRAAQLRALRDSGYTVCRVDVEIELA